MKERPILFQGAMVRALLDGSKTQTRRLMKPQMVYGDVCGLFPSWYLPNKTRTGGTLYPNAKDHILATCPYGQPGDRLWVRETYGDAGCRLTYRADLDDGAHCMVKKWTPSIHMFRADSRIVLEIVSVRVERLNDISEADAYAEGVEPEIVPVCCGEPHHENHGVLGVETYCCGSPIEDEKAMPAYEKLWESINGAGSWAANPWVWCVEFSRVTP